MKPHKRHYVIPSAITFSDFSTCTFLFPRVRDHCDADDLLARSGESTANVPSTTSTPETASTSSTDLQDGTRSTASGCGWSAPAPTMLSSCATCSSAPMPEELEHFHPDYTIYNAGSFPANRYTEGMTSAPLSPSTLPRRKWSSSVLSTPER